MTSISWKVDRLDKKDVALYKYLKKFILQDVERLLSELLDRNKKPEFILHKLGCSYFLLSQIEIYCLVDWHSLSLLACQVKDFLTAFSFTDCELQTACFN